jgi:hypothetical protein
MERMPKQGATLTEQEIAALQKWISLGLPWGAEKTAAESKPVTNKQLHWAFQPVKAVPGNIDSLVMAKLKSQGLSPAPRAKERDLVRRLYFTLTGFPPSYQQVQSYINDSSPNKHEHLINELLSQHRYGERWARVWLDVARYSDTQGYKPGGKDNRFPYSYTYRNWVIKVLNEDMPYDEFVRLQLAADHLSPPNSPHLAALGFLTLNDQFITDRLLQMDDRIDVISRGLLGLTVACARCHNHKYDPIPTKDYYAFYSILNSSEEPEILPIIGPSRNSTAGKEYAEQKAALEKKKREFLQTFYNEIRDPKFIAKYLLFAQEYLAKPYDIARGEASINGLRAKLVVRWIKFLKTQVKTEKPNDIFYLWHKWAGLSNAQFKSQVAKEWPKISADEFIHPELRLRLRNRQPLESLAELAKVYAQLFHDSCKPENEHKPSFKTIALMLDAEVSPFSTPVEEMKDFFTIEDSKIVTSIDNDLRTLELTSAGAPPRAMVMFDKPEPQDVRVMIRGNPDRLGEPAPRAWLSLFGGESFTQGSGRLQLAEKITSKENPLTARVLVNRVWLAHFGKPLVSQPSDFGVQTAQPVQHELLDHLAHGFMQNGWSLKWLHRTILTSSTWQQSCETTMAKERLDADNVFLSRMNRQRLDFESMRDAVLLTSQALDETLQKGPSIRWNNTEIDRYRSLYLFVDRYEQASVPAMFDFANPDNHSPQRFNTTVPQQSLFLMNSRFMQKHSKRIAQRHPTVSSMYQHLLARQPTAIELQRVNQFIAQQGGQRTAYQQLAQVLYMSNEFQYLD